MFSFWLWDFSERILDPAFHAAVMEMADRDRQRIRCIVRARRLVQAEEQLHAANARIGATIASLFPTISLTGSAGTVSTDLDRLFTTGTGFWNIAASLLQPIINSGRNLKQVAAERARTEAAVGQYERTVLTAFQEVEDGIVSVQRLREEAEAAARAATAARRSVVLAGKRYEGGVDNYLNLLDAQRAQLDAELRQPLARR